MSLQFRVVRVLSTRSSVCVLKQTVAHSHSLVLPEGHKFDPITSFEKGVPVNLVRNLKPSEKKWDFWTSSDAFSDVKPESGLKAVPFGQAWVIERGSSARVVASGSTLILPFVDKVKAVKNTQPVAMGVLTPSVTLKSGSSVNGYAVVYVKVVDVLKSAFYVDPETNRSDSERAAAKLVRRTLELELPSAVSGEAFTDAEKSKIEGKLKTALEAKADEYGLEVTHVEFRGVFDSAKNVSDKLRAMNAPLPGANAPGHNLSADYWAEVISPPYFQKKKFGTLREPHTPAAVTLEWVTASPPDYHHFNELPRMTVAPPADKAVKKSSH